jgi:hypothetical protein
MRGDGGCGGVGRAAPRRAVLGVAALVGALVLLASAAGIPVRATYGAQLTADEPQYLLSALSLAEDGDLNIADELAAERWRDFHEIDLPEQTRPLPGGRRVSPHDPLLPVLLAGPMALGGWIGAKLALAALAGLLAAVLVWTAASRLGVSPVPAALVVLLFGCSPPLAVYGSQVYPEVPAALAVALAAAALSGPMRRGGCTLLTACVVALPWLGVKYVPVAGVLAVLAAARLGRGRAWPRLAALVGGLAASAVVYLWAHVELYGGVTPYAAGDHFVGGEFSVVGATPNYAGRSVRLAGLLTGGRFGLAAWQPAWLLLLPAVGWLVRRRQAGASALLLPLGVGWLSATFVALTMQGWWWPGRQVVVVLPLAVLTVAAWAGGRGGRLAALGLLGSAGVLAYAWLLADGFAGRLTWVVDFWTTGNPVYQAWRRLLPDYLAPTVWTWPLHAAWSVVLVVLAWHGWRGAARSRSEDRCLPEAARMDSRVGSAPHQ